MSYARIDIPVMSSKPIARPTVRNPSGADARNQPATLWHGAWGVGVIVGAALLLIVMNTVPLRMLAALGCGASPGVVGCLLRPRTGHGAALLVFWAIASAFAMAMTGGVSGPLAVWAAAPVLAAMAMGGLWRDGAMLSFAAFVGVAMIQAGGQIDPAPNGAMGFGLGLIALTTSLAGAAAGLMIVTRAKIAEGSNPQTDAPFKTPVDDLSDLYDTLAEARAAHS
jgi:cell cycle sensor histidine kinase DivJ